MKNKLLSIGQMAKMNHTTVPTLRLYDRLGLLHPRYTDPETAYRYYDIRQNARFDLIQYMKELGMSLEEIQRILKKEDLQLVENILIKKREQVFAQIRQLRIQRDAITRAIASIERYRKSPTEGVTSLEYIDQRRIYAIPASQNFYTGTIEDFEAVLTELKNNMIAGGLPQAYYYNVGTTMTKKDFQARRFVASEVFAFVDSHFPPPCRRFARWKAACMPAST
ncbi:MAG: MerR family transcriptional regulator [Lachnospiraceae bacterium]